MYQRGERPKLLTTATMVAAAIVHAIFFIALIVFEKCFKSSEPDVIPMDLTVVVHENLDGNENEPPPTEPPKPEPPPPPPPPKPEPPPPPKPEIVEDAVVKVHDKTKKPEKKVKPPKEQEKSKKPTLEERIREMRERAKDTTNRPKPQKPQPNGRTEKRPPNWKELLNQGYKPGRTTQLATSEEQRCLSLIKMAFESKWERPPWTDTLKPMVVKVKFGPGGVILAYNLTSSSGDAAADQSILSAARRVGSVRGLTADFLNKYKGGLEIRFTVTPQ